MNKLIKQAIKICGSQTALANALGARQQDVWNWLNDKYAVSPKFAAKFSGATDGKISGHNFYPDIFPIETKK